MAMIFICRKMKTSPGRGPDKPQNHILIFISNCLSQRLSLNRQSGKLRNNLVHAALISRSLQQSPTHGDPFPFDQGW
jgi:hypothetical protein